MRGLLREIQGAGSSAGCIVAAQARRRLLFVLIDVYVALGIQQCVAVDFFNVAMVALRC